MTFFKDKKIRKALVLIFIAFVTSIFFLNNTAIGTSWSLLPPAIAIFLAFVSGHLALSLGAAVLLGSFISLYGVSQSLVSSSVGSVGKMLGFFWNAGSSVSNLQILGFVFFILSMVHMMTLSKGLHALVHSLRGMIVGPRSAQFVTALLGCIIFIDDYANTMIVGSTMKKVTDRYGISRQKLAFLVDATSAPIAGIALVSTWIGYEVGLFSEMSKKLQWGVDGYAIFLDAIPFRFYCFFMIIFVFANIIFNVDFGPMKNAPSPEVDEEEELDSEGKLICSILPLGLLLSLVFGLLWYDGGGFNGGQNFLSLTSWRNVLTQSENGILILLISSGISYSVSALLALFVAKISMKDFIDSLKAGVKSSVLPIMILLLAWSLKEVCDDLKTGEYIVSQLGTRVNPMWLPAAIFVIAAVTAFSTGTSWGTMAILIPTVSPLAMELGGGQYGVYVAMCLAAILDGAIMGDHCSPVSDTTIMSSISTECDLLEHVKTQLPYSLFVGVIALGVGYIPYNLGWPYIFSILVSFFLIVGLFFILKNWRNPRRAL